jgi:hypothetical protein
VDSLQKEKLGRRTGKLITWPVGVQRYFGGTKKLSTQQLERILINHPTQFQ